MDGVPHLTQRAIPPGDRMRYAFTVPDPGTHWLHPHVRVQRERGLFAPLIIDDPHDRGDYDVEFVVVLDDWIDGADATPDQVLATLRRGGMNARYETPVTAGKIPDRSRSWHYHVPAKLASPKPGITPMPIPARLASAVDYPFYLLNGRLPTAPHTFRAKPGQRARIRVINAGGASVFRVALGGHRLTVTHTDGFPVQPTTVDTLQVASGERYDLLITLGDGAFPLVAVAEGKAAQALGVIRTAAGPTPPPDAAPDELAGRLLDLADLRATPEVRAAEHALDVDRALYLTGDMKTFTWRINAETYNAEKPYAGITPVPVREQEQVRLVFLNQTPMYHPMHLHGHTFTVRSVGTTTSKTERPFPSGTRKDTLMVPPGERISIDFTADNPGQWLVHCHNAYHLATGMATIVSYQH
ncbi:MAG: multicopper oxidase domain-containing protein [Streptosporangiales bacterium]|nr:multicopper oxidase domain-containing protein [Streptosporangiales bacterium]